MRQEGEEMLADLAIPFAQALAVALGACQESCVKGRFHQNLLCDWEPVAEQDGELCFGGGPLALRHLPILS